MLPIYLSFDNLLKEVNVTEKNDNMANKLSVYGADGMDIRDVNPPGSNEIIDLGYHIARGDLPDGIVQKYTGWKNAIYAKAPYYTSLTAMRNAAYARYLTGEARLTALEDELASLDNLRAVNVQGRAMATKQEPASEEGTAAYFDARLAELAEQYTAKQAEIAEQKALLENINAEYEGFIADSQAVNDELRFTAFFTQDELKLLDPYLVEGVYSDPTFAVFDVDISGENDSYTEGGSADISFKDVTVVDVEMVVDTQRRILAISGGAISIHGDAYDLSARLNSGTLEQRDGSNVVFSAFLGGGKVNNQQFPSGNLSCVCKSAFDMDGLLGGMEKIVVTTEDVETGVSRDDISYQGSASFTAADPNVYFTRNVTEYQRYSVQRDLYNQAEQKLQELAYPIFEFTVKSGNLIWARDFEPFKDALKLGSAVYLKLNDKTLLKPVLLEVHLDYERPDNFALVFSSQFQTKRPDSVNSFKNALSDAKNTTRQLKVESLKYRGQEISGAANALDNFMKNGMNAAYQQVTAGLEQEVKLDKSGIKVGTRGKDEFIYIGNGMITLVDDAAKISRMAMGHFYSQEYGQDYYGIMADVLVGTLVAGKGLSIACEDVNGGGMLFKLDSSGMFQYNGRQYYQSEKGGKLGQDAHWGIFGGTKDLFEVTGVGYVHPSFAGQNGEILLDEEGFPRNVNFLLGIDGDSYFRGTVIAKAGKFTGDLYANNLYFNDGGDVKTLLSQATKKIPSGLLDLGNIQLDGASGDISLTGNINIGGSIDFSGAGAIKWGANIPNKQRFAASKSGPWHDSMQSGDIYCCDWNYATESWGEPYPKVGQDGKPGTDGSDGDPRGYLKSIKITEINQNNVKSALIEAATMAGANMYGGIFGDVPPKINGVYQSPTVWATMGKAYEGGGNAFKLFSAIDPTRAFFQFYADNLYNSEISVNEKRVLVSDGDTTKPLGTWDFSDSTPKGIPIRFGP